MINDLADYRNFDINEKINLKALLSAWTDITIDRFGEQLDKHLYSRKWRGGRDRKRAGRTRELRNNWRQTKTLAGAGSGINRINISFLLYGRFLDMGVGRGSGYHLTKYRANKRNGEKNTRKPVRWYSKRKAAETHKLRELLARYYVEVPIALLENALTTQVEITL